MKIISWNIAHSHDPWRYLLESDADIALLQEASKPPPEFSQHIEVDNSPWDTIDGGSQTNGARQSSISRRTSVLTGSKQSHCQRPE